MDKSFPADFVFGAATSAYQIEGAFDEDGRGKTWWDTHNKDDFGNPTGDVGDVACDHYHHMKEDVQLMKYLGLQTYRFSVSWVRILPKGTGEINPLGVEFYQNLITELLENGIEPAITIWHGDLPVQLDQIGGWKNPATIDAYIKYSKVLFDLYGDRVKIWFTHNEPWCGAFLGPDAFDDQLLIAHHMLIAHAKVIRLYRNHPQGNGRIGIVLNMSRQYAKTPHPLDQQARQNVDGFLNRWFIEPVLLGEYPQDMVKLYQDKNKIKEMDFSEFHLLKEYPSDFLGINMYSCAIQMFDKTNELFAAKEFRKKNTKYTEMGWPICGSSLYDLLKEIHDNYPRIPIFITENGGAFPDNIEKYGMVVDDDRIEYLYDHLKSVLNAVQDGIPVERYYVWSLMDNFEWGLGFSKKFGIIQVNYETLQRSVKKSGYYYRKVLQERRLIGEEEF